MREGEPVSLNLKDRWLTLSRGLNSRGCVKNHRGSNITVEQRRRSATKTPEKAPVKSNRNTAIAAIIVVIIVVAMVVLLQSGILSPSGSTSNDATEALQTFNSWSESVNSHNAPAAIEQTTLHFLDPTVANTLLVNIFYDIFSNQSLVFTTSNIQVIDAASMSPAQKARSEQVVTNITDQSREVHIDQIVTGYVMVLGSMELTGMDDLPAIDDLVMLKIGSGWYIVLGS